MTTPNPPLVTITVNTDGEHPYMETDIHPTARVMPGFMLDQHNRPLVWEGRVEHLGDSRWGWWPS